MGTKNNPNKHLVQDSTDKDNFVINRTFNVPIDPMYEMWTNPKHISQWIPPVGATMEYIKCDIRPGGSAFYVMTAQGGIKMYGKVQYLEFRKPHLVSYTQQFCDENEKTTRHPHAPTWPESMLTTVTFAEEGAGKTRVTVTWECDGQYTPEELETFINAKAGMTGGWTGSFDKLEDYLSRCC